MFDLTVHSGADGLHALEPEWRRLEARQQPRRPYHAFGWYRSFLAAQLAGSRDLSFYVVRREGTAVAIFPLVAARVRRFGFAVRELALPRHPHLPVNDALLDPGVPANEIVTALQNGLHALGVRWDVLFLTKVSDESTLGALRSMRMPRTRFMPIGSTGRVECDRPYGEVAKTFSSKLQSSLSRGRKRIEMEPLVEFLSVTRGPELRSSFAAFLEVEGSGWKKKAGTAIRLHPDLVRFYEGLLEESEPSIEAVINVLRANGRVIAAQFCVRDADTLHVLKIGYDETRSRLAPGNLLMERTVQSGCNDRGYRMVDLGNAPWSGDWNVTRIPLHDINICNQTPRGVALLAALDVKRRVRRWVPAQPGRPQAPTAVR